MRSSRVALNDLATGVRLLRRLPGFLRDPLTVEEARTALKHRLEHLEGDFLELMKRRVYGHEPSPFRSLLRLVGCEYGDLERLIRLNGMEGALHGLLRQGVYLTVEEVKGRQPVVRGSARFTVRPETLRNPGIRAVLSSRTSGSRGAGTLVPMDLIHLRDRAVNSLLVMDARGGRDWSKAQWGVPGGGALAQLLEFSCFGLPVSRWFTQVDPGELASRYRWSTRVVRWGSLAAGRALPWPETATLDDPSPVVDWVREALRQGGVPHLFTFASSALRLCQAVGERGHDLAGLQLTVTGEPLTPARLAVIQQSGAVALTRYAMTECGAVGFGCLRPSASDDVHVPLDLHRIIQPGDAAPTGVPARGLFVTAMRPTAPVVLLNVSLGDQAQMDTTECGCPLQGLGWTTHLRSIRSYEKLTAGGMTFLDRDVIRLLEEELPRRFGGGPADYQLVEEERADGRPQLRLLVHPRVGSVDSEAVSETFLSTLGAGAGSAQVMSLAWRGGHFLRVERRAPFAVRSGKVLHLHVERGTPPPTP